jgi:tRNA pseudouridine38-40 synthase
MRAFKLTIAYDGTSFVGWQRQPNGVSIQQLLEEAFAPLVGHMPSIAGAGRTDAGVHALGQVASVTLDVDHSTTTVQRALNARLPSDVRITAVEEAPPGFHARFDAVAKSYRYRMANGAWQSPFDRWFVWYSPVARDLEAMRRAACRLVGCHDFASFQAAGGAATDTVRTIHALEVRDHGREVTIDVTGDGFLRHMVRAIVGTLAEVGLGARAPESVTEILAARDRGAAGETAPACGLTLVSVRYGQEGEKARG